MLTSDAKIVVGTLGSFGQPDWSFGLRIRPAFGRSVREALSLITSFWRRFASGRVA